MFNFGSFLLCSLAAWSLWNGCLAMDHNSDYVCLVDDPNPDEDNFCLTTLEPVLNQIDRRLHSGNKKVHSLADQLDKMQLQLQELVAAQTRLERQLQAVLDAEQGALKLTQYLINHNVPSNFEPIGSRYFLIVEKPRSWASAKSSCLDMGGYLASIQSKEELVAINAKLEKSSTYWLGINDLQDEGHYISVAANKTAKILEWSSSQSEDENHKQNCVYLLDGYMGTFMCDLPMNFICQADNEI